MAMAVIPFRNSKATTANPIAATHNSMDAQIYRLGDTERGGQYNRGFEYQIVYL